MKISDIVVFYENGSFEISIPETENNSHYIRVIKEKLVGLVFPNTQQNIIRKSVVGEIYYTTLYFNYDEICQWAVDNFGEESIQYIHPTIAIVILKFAMKSDVAKFLLMFDGFRFEE